MHKFTENIPDQCNGYEYNEYCTSYYKLLEAEHREFSSSRQSQPIENCCKFTNVYGERMSVENKRHFDIADGITVDASVLV